MKDNFKDLTYEELHSKLDELKKKHMDIRFNSVLGHVDNPVLKRTLRRKIARLKTLIHQKDLGISKG
jgi:large subunit ribosomal protein L29